MRLKKLPFLICSLFGVLDSQQSRAWSPPVPAPGVSLEFPGVPESQAESVRAQLSAPKTAYERALQSRFVSEADKKALEQIYQDFVAQAGADAPSGMVGTHAELEIRKELGIRWFPARTEFSAERTAGAMGGYRVRVHLHGRMESLETRSRCAQANLLGDRPLEIDENGDFEFVTLMTGEVTPVQLACVSDLGTVDLEKLIVHFPNRASAASELLGPESKPDSFFVGLALTSIDYRDSGSGVESSYGGISTTLKASASRWLVPGKWVAGATGFLTLAPISRTGSESAETLRFLGLNARVGYTVPTVQEPWLLSVMGGWYYSSTLVTTSRFGYRHVMGPQVYPTLRYITSNGEEWSGYLKFSPVSNRLGFLTLASRELAVGVSYQRPRSEWSLQADFSDLSFSFGGDDPYQMQSRTFSLGLGRVF